MKGQPDNSRCKSDGFIAVTKESELKFWSAIRHPQNGEIQHLSGHINFTVNERRVFFRKKNMKRGICIGFGFGFCSNNQREF
jgi:hypothetical protein